MCIMCEGASRDEVLFNLHATVLRHGWALQGVVGHDPPGADRVYTVGLARGFAHPEFVMVGAPIRDAAAIVDALGELVRAGRRFGPGDQVDVLDGRVGLGVVHPVHLANGLVALWDDYYTQLGPPLPGRFFLQVLAPGPGSCCAQHDAMPILADPTADPDSLRTRWPNRAERRRRERAQRRRGCAGP